MVGYYSVSTESQGQSGLGLAAQEAAVKRHVQVHGCRLLAAYTEVETGKRDSIDDRPELQRAIAHAKRSKATLVVAKMDRLTRSVAVTAMLHQSNIDFIACDNPNANRMTIQILAAVAENEVRQISERTKAALAAYKARGGLLGAALPQSRNLTPEARDRGIRAASEARRQRARDAYADLGPYLHELRSGGFSLSAIAAKLNEDGQTTRRGRPWRAMQVKRVLSLAPVAPLSGKPA